MSVDFDQEAVVAAHTGQRKAVGKENSLLKKILLIAPQPFFSHRGTPFNVRAMASTLGELGYHVDLLVYHLGQDVVIPGVSIHRTLPLPWIRSVPPGPSWRKIAYDIVLLGSALRLMLTGRYHAVHGVEEGGIIASLLGRLRRIPCVFDMDSWMSEQLANSGFFKSRRILNLVRSLEENCICKSDAVLTVCEELTERAREIAPNVPVYQIEDFPLDSALQVNPKLIMKLSNEFASAGRKVILYTGNLESYQGIDLLFHSFKIVLDTVANVKEPLFAKEDVVLLMVGGGSEDDPQIIKYKQLARELGIEHALTFAGQRPAEEMGSFMALANILVSPRVVGGNTPLKIYSYMASNKPIVATQISAHTQILSNETAFLAKPTSEDFSQLLLAALDDSIDGYALRKERANRAKYLVETRYSKKEFVRRLGQLYQGLIGPGACDGQSPLLIERVPDEKLVVQGK